MVAVAQEALGVGVSRGRRGWFLLSIFILVIAGVAVTIPPADADDLRLIAGTTLFLQVLHAFEVARRQWRFGRPISRVATAVIVSTAAALLPLTAFIALNQAFGADRLPSASGTIFDGPLGTIPTEVILVALSIVAVAILIKLVLRLADRDSLQMAERAKQAAIEAEYQAERDARAAAAGRQAADR